MGAGRITTSNPNEFLQQIIQDTQNAGHAAVLSIQSIHGLKTVLKPSEIDSFVQNNPAINFDKTGDGHTGLAMARALNAPFAVARTSAEEKARVGETLTLGHGSLLILTGHGSPGTSNITGNYIRNATDHFTQQINRGPDDIVASAMAAGLKPGMRINILLSICYGGSESTAGKQDSFAEKLARAFALHGISSNIMASNQPVKRFGSDAIRENKIQFDENTGMAAENLHVFSTNVSGPTMRPKIIVSRPNKVIELSTQGLHFTDAKPTREAVLDKMAAALNALNLPPDLDYDISPFLDRRGAEAQLAHDKHTRFIIRGSSVEGYLAITYRNEFNEYKNKLLKIDELYDPNLKMPRVYELTSSSGSAEPTKTHETMLDFINEHIPFKKQPAHTHVEIPRSAFFQPTPKILTPEQHRDAALQKVSKMLNAMNLSSHFYYTVSTFLDREDAEAMLKQDKQTQFIIRPSRIPGCVTLSTLKEDNTFAHSLLSMNEINASSDLAAMRIHTLSAQTNHEVTPTDETLMSFINKRITAAKQSQTIWKKPSDTFPSGSPPFIEPNLPKIGRQRTPSPDSTAKRTKIGIHRPPSPQSAEIPTPPTKTLPQTQITAASDPSTAGRLADQANTERSSMNLLQHLNLEKIKNAVIVDGWTVSQAGREGATASRNIRGKEHTFLIKPNRYETHEVNQAIFETMLRAFKATHPDKQPVLTTNSLDAVLLIKAAAQKVYPGVEPNIVLNDPHQAKTTPEVDSPRPRRPGQ